MIRFKKWIRLLSLLLITVQCKTTSKRSTSNPDAPPPGTPLYLVAPERLTCTGKTALPDNLFNRFVHNEDVSETDWQMQKLALQSSLSAVPPQLILQLIAHGGDLRVARNAYDHCDMKNFNIPNDKPVSYCIKERDNKFTIYLSAYENDQASIKAANIDAVYGLLDAYVHRVVSNQLTDKGIYPRLEETITNYSAVVYQLYNRLVQLGLTLPVEAQEDIFVSLSYMSLCSDITRDDLKRLIPDAQDRIYTIIQSVFTADNNSKVIQDLVSNIGGLGLFTGLLDDLFGKSFRDLAADQRVFQSSQQRYRTAIETSSLTTPERTAALSDLEAATKPDPGAPFLYRGELETIRGKPAFEAIYNAQHVNPTTGCFLQVPKKTDSIHFSTEITGETKRVTITVHGTFDSSGVKVGGGWADPIGETAERYAKVTHGRAEQSLDGSDFVAAFRWKGENEKINRREAAESLADSLMNIMIGRNELKQITSDNPLEISLVGHSHGGNVSYETLKVIQERARNGNKEALAFLTLVSQGKIKIRVMGIATPKRADYIPPSWAGVVHVTTLGDGVAFLGRSDALTPQITRFVDYVSGKEVKHGTAWKRAQDNNITEVQHNTYGPDHALDFNHIYGPEGFGSRIYEEKYKLPDSYLNPEAKGLDEILGQ